MTAAIPALPPQAVPSPADSPAAPAPAADGAERPFAQVLEEHLDTPADSKPDDTAPATAASGQEGRTDAAQGGKVLPPEATAVPVAVAVPVVPVVPVVTENVMVPASLAAAAADAALPLDGAAIARNSTPTPTAMTAPTPPVLPTPIALGAGEVNADFEATMLRQATEARGASLDGLALAQYTASDSANGGQPQSTPSGAPPVSAQGATTTIANTSITVPIDRPGWDQALGQRIQWLINTHNLGTGQVTHGAQLQLNPPDLGPLEVRITVQHDQTSIAFSSQHGPVREALESALPRLREILGEQGLNLVDVSVSQHSFMERRDPQTTDSGRAFTAAPMESIGDDVLVPEGVRYVTRGLVDYYV